MESIEVNRLENIRRGVFRRALKRKLDDAAVNNENKERIRNLLEDPDDFNMAYESAMFDLRMKMPYGSSDQALFGDNQDAFSADGSIIDAIGRLFQLFIDNWETIIKIIEKLAVLF